MQLKEESLFHEAMDILDTEARAAFLNKACNGDQDLRRRVERLISVFPKGDVLEPIDGTGASESIRERVGDIIGRYKLLEQLGEGGMGVVYMPSSPSRSAARSR